MNSSPLRWFVRYLLSCTYHSLFLLSSLYTIQCTPLCISIGVYCSVQAIFIFLRWNRFKLNMYDVDTTHKSFNNISRKKFKQENMFLVSPKHIQVSMQVNASHSIFPGCFSFKYKIILDTSLHLILSNEMKSVP